MILELAYCIYCTGKAFGRLERRPLNGPKPEMRFKNSKSFSVHVVETFKRFVVHQQSSLVERLIDVVTILCSDSLGSSFCREKSYD